MTQYRFYITLLFFVFLTGSCSTYHHYRIMRHIPKDHKEGAIFFLKRVKRTKKTGVLKIEYDYHNGLYIDYINSKLQTTGWWHLISYLEMKDVIKLFGKPMKSTYYHNMGTTTLTYYVLNNECPTINGKILPKNCNSLTITYSDNKYPKWYSFGAIIYTN